MQCTKILAILALHSATTSGQRTVVVTPMPPGVEEASTTSVPTPSIFTITAPPIRAISSAPSDATSACHQTLCIDFINACSLKYGGCFEHCYGDPVDVAAASFMDPGCPHNSYFPEKPTFTTFLRTATCGYTCEDYFDDCGNTFGPGCYTSCAGVAPPSFTTPVCETSVATTTVMEMTYTDRGSVTSAGAVPVETVLTAGLER